MQNTKVKNQFKVTVLCDRCCKKVHGVYDPKYEKTEGFYRVEDDKSPYAEYAKGHEKVICESCMKLDKRYLARQH